MMYCRVDISRSGGKASVGGDMMKITRLSKKSKSDQYQSLEGKEPFEGMKMHKSVTLWFDGRLICFVLNFFYKVIVEAPGSNFL